MRKELVYDIVYAYKFLFTCDIYFTYMYNIIIGCLVYIDILVFNDQWANFTKLVYINA